MLSIGGGNEWVELFRKQLGKIYIYLYDIGTKFYAKNFQCSITLMCKVAGPHSQFTQNNSTLILFIVVL